MRDCSRWSSLVGPGGFVQPRRTPSAGRTGRAEPPPGAPSALSPPSHPSLPGQEPPPRPQPLSLLRPGTRRAPGPRAQPSLAGVAPKASGLCGVSGGRRATCASPAAASGKTRRGGGPGEEQRKAARLDLFAQDWRRARVSPRGVRSESPRPRLPARAAEAGGWSAAPAHSPRAPDVSAQVLEAAGPGAPTNVALRAGARTDGSGSRSSCGRRVAGAPGGARLRAWPARSPLLLGFPA